MKRREIVALVSAGDSLEGAAKYVGCSMRTVRREMERNEGFGEHVRQARVAARLAPLKAMRQAAGTHWRAAAWMLERTHPDRFGRAQKRALGRRELKTLARDLMQVIRQEVVDPLQLDRIEDRLEATINYALHLAGDQKRTGGELQRAMQWFDKKNQTSDPAAYWFHKPFYDELPDADQGDGSRFSRHAAADRRCDANRDDPGDQTTPVAFAEVPLTEQLAQPAPPPPVDSPYEADIQEAQQHILRIAAVHRRRMERRGAEEERDEEARASRREAREAEEAARVGDPCGPPCAAGSGGVPCNAEADRRWRRQVGAADSGMPSHPADAYDESASPPRDDEFFQAIRRRLTKVLAHCADQVEQESRIAEENGFPAAPEGGTFVPKTEVTKGAQEARGASREARDRRRKSG